MSGQGGSLATAAAVLKTLGHLSPLLRIAAGIGALLTGLALALGVLGWMRPIFVKQATARPPAQSITFSYSARVPLTPAYDGTTVTSPDPVFRKLANRADLRALYEGPAGTLRLTATLTNGSGWHTTIVLAKETPFSGSRHEATVTLDFSALTARADAAALAIGAPPDGTVSIALDAQVKSTNLPDLNAPLQLVVTPFQMALGGNAKLRTTTEAGPAPTIAVPREIRILDVSVMTAAKARSSAILALIAAGVIAAVVFLTSRRALPVRTRPEIERRFSQLLVHVEPMASPPGKPVVNVDNFPALVKLAERYGQMILTWRRPDADDFVVRDEGITYRYRVPLDEPTLVNVERINRPSTTGSHRKKASSDVS